MGHGVKDDVTLTNGWRSRLVLLCLVNFSAFIVPVSGFALKFCHISNKDAICEGRNITDVPKGIPSTVKGFDLSKNNISIINAFDFQNYSALTDLDLSSNNISWIDAGAFSSLICLEQLNINKNKLVELEDGLFDGLENLVRLYINKNRIKTVASAAFRSMSSLKVLDLTQNKLHHLSQVHFILQHLPRLQTLFIQSNRLTTFYSWELTNSSLKLDSLDLSQNPITAFSITADIFQRLTCFSIGGSQHKDMKWDVNNQTFLSRVSTLDVSGLQMAFEDMRTLLQTVNTSLSTLRMNAIKHSLRALINVSCTIPTMSSLELRGNKLTSIPSDMFNGCVNVTELDLTGNLIHRIHDGAFRSLPSLRILSLGRNKLSSVPVALRDLTGLQELDLNTNKLSKLGCGDFSNNKNLRQLSLFKNSISSLSECVFKDLEQLQVLLLQTNHLSKLNGTFKNTLPNLKQLRLNGNRLNTIKAGEFEGLQSLKDLSLLENQLRILEKGCFVGLTNLTVLLLQKNQIKELNIGVFNVLINLRRLDIRENHIKYQSSSPLKEPPFSNLSKLEIFAMPSQHRREKSYLPSNLLQGLTNLLFFNTRSIQLLSLDKDMFKHTPRLQKLDISSNELTDFSPELFSPIPNLKSLYISRTSLSSLDFLQYANLTHLEFLQARRNQYSVISEGMMGRAALPALIYLDLQGNSFTCDCTNAWFLEWTKNNIQTQVFDAYNFVCNYPLDLKGMKLLDLDVQSCLVDVEFICYITTSCAILLFMVASFTYHFLRWQLAYAYYLFLALLFDSNQKNKDTANQYDAFISYNTNDEPWVIREMLPKLEKEQGWRICLHHRDFEPGKPIIDNITDAIYQSRKTICVISRQYLESEWCSKEIQVASFRLFDEGKDVLILIFLEEIPAYLLCPYYRMRKLLKKRTYLNWPRAAEHKELFWEKLRQALKTRGGLVEDSLDLSVADSP